MSLCEISTTSFYTAIADVHYRPAKVHVESFGRGSFDYPALGLSWPRQACAGLIPHCAVTLLLDVSETKLTKLIGMLKNTAPLTTVSQIPPKRDRKVVSRGTLGAVYLNNLT